MANETRDAIKALMHGGKLSGSPATRRAFLIKSAGVLGGVALGLYVTPAMNTIRVSSVHANVSPCPVSSPTTSDPNGTNPTATSQCDISPSPSPKSSPKPTPKSSPKPHKTSP